MGACSRRQARDAASFVRSCVATSVRCDERQRWCGAYQVCSTGLKIFERQDKDADVPCSYRLSQEGLQAVLPFLGKQKFRMSVEEYQRFLNKRQLPFKGDEASENFSKETLETIRSDLVQGCVVAIPDIEKSLEKQMFGKAEELAVVCWLGTTNISLLVSKPEAVQLLERMGCDTKEAWDAKASVPLNEGTAAAAEEEEL
ncbi:hypothetical protein CYMTET_29206 [Cymbomonas tetramitiformis]|uniref:Uncharacterized protein n=1 Tax=Cymbomonas tetramitiformis TaxID=36881 RepID=A0AAE0KV61_9CHLO|nr:hypothetical protein CYMTET_29206 [Cymbomonas tetramitiformis]